MMDLESAIASLGHERKSYVMHRGIEKDAHRDVTETAVEQLSHILGEKGASIPRG
jgi:hypothetical protein